MLYKITRISTGQFGTFGVLLKEGIPLPLCCTAEPPWLNNVPDKSCIPEGVYICAPHTGQKYKKVWVLNDVPGRSGILIHWGNYPVPSGNKRANTEGCILVGRSFGVLDSRYAIKDSVLALNGLRDILPKEFTLTIKNAF